MKKSLLFLVLMSGCVAVPRNESGQSQDAAANQGGAQSPKLCGGDSQHPLGPHEICMTYNSPLTEWPTTGLTPPSTGSTVLNVPEPCWNDQTCECLQANMSIPLCTDPGTACETHIVNLQYSLACACSGSCCQRTPDGYSVYTCACRGINGPSLCTSYNAEECPWACVDTPDDGAICEGIDGNLPDSGCSLGPAPR